MSRTYDEDAVLTDYIWHNDAHLFTEFDRLVAEAAFIEFRAQNSSPTLAQRLYALRNHEDPAIAIALSDGPETFRRRMRDLHA